MNDFVELRRIMSIILRRWWWLVIAAVLAALLGNIISRQQTPVYQATTTILIGDSIKSPNVDRVDIQVSEALVQTYVEIARRQPVLQGVITTLNLNQSWQSLNDQIQVTLIESTQLIEIVVEANSPEMARMIADEIVNQMILLNPASVADATSETVNNFNREQLESLQQRIVDGQNRLAEIDTAMSTSISEIELDNLQREKTTLQGLMVEWEKNYTQLLVITEPKRNPTQITVIESAHSNNRQIRPRIQLNTILSGLVGLIIALGVIFLMDFLDDTYKSFSDFSQSEEVNILGSIRKIKGRKLADKLVAHLSPYSPVTESYRIIRSRIRFRPGDNPTRSIMVTSSMPAEGKSVTVANLAVVFAQANYKTLVVDAELRHPVLHEMFNVSNEVGLGDLLSSPELTVEECVRDTAVNNLQILTSGMPLLDPSERLGSKRMEEILSKLKTLAEVVILDSPPVLVFADAIVLSRRIDGVIVVIQAGKTKRSAIAQTFFDLQNANANLLGSIFNQSPESDTFSVNKAYMQERPQLPTPRTLKKKESAGSFQDLRNAASPLTGSMLLDREEAVENTIQLRDLAESEVLEYKGALQESREAAVTPINENPELENDEAVVAETEFNDSAEAAGLEHKEPAAELREEVAHLPENPTLENEKFSDVEASLAETSALSENLEPETDETEEGSLSSDVARTDLPEHDDRKNHKRRSRKNRHNGHITSINHDSNFPKNGKTHALTDEETSNSIDQNNVQVDQKQE